MTNAEMESYRQALMQQEQSIHDWQSSRFAGVDESEPNPDQKINARVNGHHVKPGAERKGSGRGYNSPEAKAKRKGIHDVHSGRLTPEAIAVMPTPELYEAAWRTRGELGPNETLERGMKAGKEYSMQSH